LLGALLVITYAFVALYTLVPALGVTHFSIRTECRAGSILVSALLACLAAEGRLRLPGWTVPFVILAGLATFWWRFPAWITYTLGSALLALGLNQIDRGPKWLLAILRSRGLMLLGLWSYSIYLWQQPFYLAKINPILGAALAVAAGIASFYLLESPVRRWLNRHWAVERRTRVAVV
jgi:peptidoglycan/LPS O-acetylase OafA/YrhL